MSDALLCLNDFRSKIKYALRTPTFNAIESMIENQTGKNYSLDWLSKRTHYNLSHEPRLLARLGFRDTEVGIRLECKITLGDIVMFEKDGVCVDSTLSINKVKEFLHALTDYYKYLLRTHLKKPLPHLEYQGKLMTAFEQLVTN